MYKAEIHELLPWITAAEIEIDIISEKPISVEEIENQLQALKVCIVS